MNYVEVKPKDLLDHISDSEWISNRSRFIIKAMMEVLNLLRLSM